jgi:hypothetical protein
MHEKNAQSIPQNFSLLEVYKIEAKIQIILPMSNIKGICLLANKANEACVNLIDELF